MTKAKKFQGVLGKLHTLKPNRLEAELLSGIAIHNDDDLRRAAKALLDTGSIGCSSPWALRVFWPLITTKCWSCPVIRCA